MAARVFVSYSHRDEALYERLAKHLKPLEYEGVIEPWYDRQISAGAEFDKEISTELESAEIILLLVSSDYLASDYCWGKELKRSMERHNEQSAHVVPIILRPVEWRGSPFGKLLALPKDGKPVTSWSDSDEAFLNVTQSIRNLATKMNVRKASASAPAPAQPQEVKLVQNGLAPLAKAAAQAVMNAAAAASHVPAPGYGAVTGGTLFSVTFVRHGLLDPGRTQKFEVYLDEEKVGTLRRGETVQFSANPGTHVIQVRRLWTRSKALPFSTAADEQIALECMLTMADSSAALKDRALGACGIGETISLKRIS